MKMGILKIPVGIEKGKIQFLDWCSTGQHFHTVYWRSDQERFSTVHPKEEVDES
jgi:hypothetical protein